MIPENETKYSGLPKMSIIKEFDSAVIALIRKLKIPTLCKRNLEDLPYSSFNGDTYPGFTYSEYFNFKNKNEAAKKALEISCKKWSYITNSYKNGNKLRRNNLFPGTYAVGARNKRNFDAESFRELNSRAVHMPEFHNEIHLATWMDPISDYIKDSKKGPIYIGNSIVEYQRLYKDMFNCESVIEGDVSRFDSRIYLTFIIMAISVCRLYYDISDKEIDYHFIAIFDSIAIKDYYTPGGYIYRMIHGIPSGVKCTSTLGSIINLLLQIKFNINVDQKLMNYCIGGDDFLTGYKIKVFEAQVDKINKEAEKVGWELKYLKLKDFNNPDINERPYFYKYSIDKGEPIISTQILIERCFMPWNKNYNNFSKVYNFLLDLFPSLGCPRSHMLIFYELCAYVHNRHANTIKDSLYFFKLHKAIYNKVMFIDGYIPRKSSYNRVNCSIYYKTIFEGDKNDTVFTGTKKIYLPVKINI